MKFFPFTPLRKSNSIINVAGRACAIHQTLFGSHANEEYQCGVLDYLTLGLYPLSYAFFKLMNRPMPISHGAAEAFLFIFIATIVLAIAFVVSAILKAAASLVLTPIFTLLDTIGRTIHYAFTHTTSQFCDDAAENFETISRL